MIRRPRLRPFTSALTGFVCVLFAGGASGQVSVTLCDSENPPYSIGAEDGTPAEGGRAVALARAVFDRIEGAELEVVLMPWARCLQEARTGSVDGVLKLSYRDDRAEYLDFTEQPIYRMTVAFFHRREDFPDGLRWETFADLSEHTLGVVTGSSSGPVIDAAIEDGTFRTDTATSDKQNILKLARGRIDLFADDRIMGMSNVRALDLEGEIVASDQAASSNPILIGLSKLSAARNLLPRIDEVLAEMWASGEADEILSAVE